MQCLTPILIKNKHPIGDDYYYRYVPCGRCEACVNRKKSEWFVRLKQEELSHDNTCFVTLTYDDEHIPNDYSVSQSDCQLFMKRLRSKLSYPIKYYLTSEYGPQTLRPHYHAIFFGLSPFDYSKIEEAWQSGFVTVSEVTDERLRYVCGYVIEKLFTPEGRRPIFNLISKGLGRKYVDKYSDWHQEGGIIERGYTPIGDKRLPLPRYYKEKIYNSCQRRVLEKQCVVEAEKTFEQLVQKYGDNVYKRIVESRISYAEKARKVHKKKKQL